MRDGNGAPVRRSGQGALESLPLASNATHRHLSVSYAIADTRVKLAACGWAGAISHRS